MTHSKKAFSLVEVLVVIAIISLLLTGVSMLNTKGASQLAGTSQRILMNSIREAKSLSMSKHERARVLIYRGDDPTRKYRHVAVLYELTDEDGNSEGWITNSEYMLPNGAFFVPPSSDYVHSCKINSSEYKDSDIIKSDVSTIVSISTLSTKAQTMYDGSGDWYAYEFSPEGLSENSGECVTVAVGKYNGKNFMITSPQDQLGFIIRKFGNPAAFSSYNEMKTAIGQL